MAKARDYEKHEKAFQSDSYGDSNFIKWKEGETKQIRILPHVEELKGKPGFENEYIKEIGIHDYKDNEGNYAPYKCPKKCNGDPCPTCEWVNSLFKTKKEENIDLAKKRKVKIRGIAQFIVRDNNIPEHKVFINEFSKTTAGDIIREFKSLEHQKEDWGNIEKGRDIRVTKFKDPSSDFAQWKVGIAAAPSPLVRSAESFKKILDNLKPLEDYIAVESYEEIANRIGWKGTSEVNTKYIEKETKKEESPPDCLGSDWDEDDETCKVCNWFFECNKVYNGKPAQPKNEEENLQDMLKEFRKKHA